MIRKRIYIVGESIVAIIMFISLLVGFTMGVHIAFKYHNYIFLSYVTYILLKMIREVLFEKRISKILVKRKPYTTKVVIKVTMIITFILSIKFLVCYFIFMLASFYYIEYEKQQRKKRRGA